MKKLTVFLETAEDSIRLWWSASEWAAQEVGVTVARDGCSSVVFLSEKPTEVLDNLIEQQLIDPTKVGFVVDDK